MAVPSRRSLKKIAGSGSVSQRYGSTDPDLDTYQNVTDPQHCFGLKETIRPDDRSAGEWQPLVVEL